jgi:GNAT superfamily N-acetyltransferase
MWDALPIQRGSAKGPNFATIYPDFPYPKYPDVRSEKWRDVDVDTRRWAMSLWCVHFGIRRCPAGPDDLFLWIPYLATLLAKCGTLGENTLMVSVHCNYVDPVHRGKGLAQKLILTMAHELSPRKFMFELQNVPRSLAAATPFFRFSYVWIPLLGNTPCTRVPVDLRGIPGFHPTSCAGYRMFRSGAMRILVDPHDDIVWFDGGFAWGLVFIDIPCSRYIRWFSPYGNIRVYAQNMYFSPPDYSKPALIG